MLLPGTASGESSLRLDPFSLGLEQPEAAALQSAIEKAEWPVAEDLLFRSSEAEPRSAAILRALGIAHYQAGRPYPAAAALHRADAISPLDPEARFLLASCFLLLERRHWARSELERLARDHPRHLPYRIALARLHHDDQRFMAGSAELRQAIALAGGSVAALDLLGQCLEALGHHEDASEAYREAILLNESQSQPSPWPHFHLGSLLHDLGDMEPARESLEAAAAIDPGNASVQLELGIVLRKSGDLPAAVEVLEAAARDAPNDAAIQYALAAVYSQTGQKGRSAAAIRRLRAISDRPR